MYFFESVTLKMKEKNIVINDIILLRSKNDDEEIDWFTHQNKMLLVIYNSIQISEQKN